jgi:hypothetical protein
LERPDAIGLMVLACRLAHQAWSRATSSGHDVLLIKKDGA